MPLKKPLDTFTTLRYLSNIKQKQSLTLAEAVMRRHVTRPVEMTFKEFCHTQAKKICRAPGTVGNQIRRGKYPQLKIRSLNARVKFVEVA